MRASLPQRLSHSGERGTAIFVVLMVVTLLTGIGLFAARVTGSVDTATGNARQSAQATGLAIYAAQLAPVELAVDPTFVAAPMASSAQQVAVSQCPTNGPVAMAGLKCSLRRHQDLISLATRTGATAGILTPQAADSPGSLGPKTGSSTVLGVEGNLQLEYFDSGPAPPVPGLPSGSNLAGARPLEYSVTASSQTRPVIAAANTNWCSPDNTASSANVQSVRLYIIAP